MRNFSVVKIVKPEMTLGMEKFSFLLLLLLQCCGKSIFHNISSKLLTSLNSIDKPPPPPPCLLFLPDACTQTALLKQQELVVSDTVASITTTTKKLEGFFCLRLKGLESITSAPLAWHLSGIFLKRIAPGEVTVDWNLIFCVVVRRRRLRSLAACLTDDFNVTLSIHRPPSARWCSIKSNVPTRKRH